MADAQINLKAGVIILLVITTSDKITGTVNKIQKILLSLDLQTDVIDGKDNHEMNLTPVERQENLSWIIVLISFFFRFFDNGV